MCAAAYCLCVAGRLLLYLLLLMLLEGGKPPA
jgi:hypothetical protein